MANVLAMSEPKARAQRIEEVQSGVFRWHLKDERIGGAESDAYAVRSDDGRVVLIDPLPVDEKKLKQLGEISSIILTASCHQRSAWRYRRLFAAQIYAPEDAENLEQEPDLTYSGGEALPLGIVPLHSPGPTEAMYALWLDRPRHILFLSDLLAHDGSGRPDFIDSSYQDDPQRTRVSVQRLLDKVPAQVLLFSHGPPILEDGARVLREVLERDTEFPEARAP